MSTRMRRWVIAIAGLNLVLFVALMILVLQRGPAGGSDTDASASADPAATETTATEPAAGQGESSEPEPQQTETDGEVTYVFPPGTLALTDFTLPSGNISCSLEESQVTCWIASKAYAAPEGMTCEWAGQVFVLSESGVDLPCPAAAPAVGTDLPVLEYGQATGIGSWYCQSSTNGVSCTSYGEVSGASRGFTIARAEYTLLAAG